MELFFFAGVLQGWRLNSVMNITIQYSRYKSAVSHTTSPGYFFISIHLAHEVTVSLNSSSAPSITSQVWGSDGSSSVN